MYISEGIDGSRYQGGLKIAAIVTAIDPLTAFCNAKEIVNALTTFMEVKKMCLPF